MKSKNNEKQAFKTTKRKWCCNIFISVKLSKHCMVLDNGKKLMVIFSKVAREGHVQFYLSYFPSIQHVA